MQVVWKKLVRRFAFSQRLGSFEAASGFHSIPGSRQNICPSATGSAGVSGGTGGSFSLLADEDVDEDSRPLVREEMKD